MPGYRLTDSAGLPCTLWIYAMVQIDPLGCPHRTFLLRFTCFRSMPVQIDFPWRHWIAHTEHFFCVLQALGDARLQIDSVGVPTLNVSQVFYRLWQYARVQIDSIGLSTLSASIVLYHRWRHARVQIDSIGLPTLSISMLFDTLWRRARVQIDSIGLPILIFSIAFCTPGRHAGTA